MVLSTVSESGSISLFLFLSARGGVILATVLASRSSPLFLFVPVRGGAGGFDGGVSEAIVCVLVSESDSLSVSGSEHSSSPRCKFYD